MFPGMLAIGKNENTPKGKMFLPLGERGCGVCASFPAAYATIELQYIQIVIKRKIDKSILI